MLTRAADQLVNWLEWWVVTVARAARLVLPLLLAITIACVFYTVRHVSVNSDTAEMIDPNVPYRADWAAFKSVFPQDDEAILIVVDGRSPEAAEAAAAAIKDGIEANRGTIDHVFWAAGDPFFRRNGLLFLDLDAIAELSDQLASAQPMLAQLAQDPSLRGLLAVIDQGLDAAARGEASASAIADLLEALTPVFEARLAGTPQNLSWRSLLGDSAADAGGRRQMIVVKPMQDFAALEPSGAAVATIRAVIGELPKSIADEATVRLTGEAMLSYEELASVTQGAGLAVVISLILVALILVGGLGSAWMALSAFITLIFGLIWTATFAIVAVGSFNLISVAFAVLFVGLGVDFAIHFALRYREQFEAGHDRLAALARATRGVGPALAFLAAGTATGFLAFVPTPYVGLSELGLIAGAGMFIALVATLTVLPALLALRPLRPARQRRRPLTLSIEAMIWRHAGSVALAVAVLAVGAAFLAPSLRFDEDPINLKDPETESVSTLRDVVAGGQPLYPIEIMARDRAAASALADEVRNLPGVGRVLTIDSFVPADQQEKLAVVEDTASFLLPVFAVDEAARPPTADETRVALRSTAERIRAGRSDGSLAAMPESTDAFADAALRLAGAAETTIVGADGNVFAWFPQLLQRLSDAISATAVTSDSLPAMLRERWLSADGRARVQVIAAEDGDKGQLSLRSFVDSVQAVVPDASGPAVATVGAGRAVTHALLLATVYAVGALTLLLLVALRRVSDVLLVLIPVLLAGLFAAATAVLLSIDLNFANVIVLPLMLGIGLAGCGQLLMRARLEPEGTPLFATVTPLATILSMMTTICSFGSLVVSSHRGTSGMGMLLTIAISWSLIATLVLLPALLELRRRLRRPGFSRDRPTL